LIVDDSPVVVPLMNKILSSAEYEVFVIDDSTTFFDGSAEVLIHDSRYIPEEYVTKIGCGYLNYEVAVRTALYGRVKHLVLFHHDPSRTDDSMDDILKQSENIILSEGGSLEVSAANEHVSVRL